MPVGQNKKNNSATGNKEAYDFYLSGTISKGYSIEKATNWLAGVLKLPNDKTSLLLQGQERQIKQNLSKEEAKKYQQLFLSQGIITLCRRVRTVAPKTPRSKLEPGGTSKSALPQKQKQQFIKGSPEHQVSKITVIGSIIANAISLSVAVVVYASAVLLLAIVFLNRIFSPFFQQHFPSTLALFFLYLVPAIVVGTLLVLLLRPWLQTYDRDRNWHTLDERQQGKLRNFVDELCQNLSLTPPDKLAINGEQFCKSHYAFNFPKLLQGERTLSISLPLLLNFSCQQFAADIAHELAKINRPSAALLNKLSNKFLRRLESSADNDDNWVRQLKACQLKTSNKLLKGSINAINKLLFTGSYCLRPFCIVDNKVNLFVNRITIKSADDYAISLVGSRGFTETLLRHQEVQFAVDQASKKLFHSIGQLKLVDNLPLLVEHILSTINEKTRKQIHDSINVGDTRQFENYPTDRTRIIVAEELDVNGLKFDNIPARELFHSLEELCKKGTLLFYENENISANSDGLLPVSELTNTVQKDHLRDSICSSFFNNWFNALSFWRVPTPDSVKSLTQEQRVTKLKECIHKIRHATPDYLYLLELHPRVLQTRVQLATANEVLKAGYSIHSESLKLNPNQGENFSQYYESSKKEYLDLKARLNSYHELMGMRLFLALSVHPDQGKRRIGALLLQTLLSLYQQSQLLDTLAVRVNYLPVLAARAQEQKETELLKKIQRVCKDIENYGQSAIASLHRHQCTFHQDSSSVGDFVAAHIKQKIDFQTASTLQVVAYYHEILFGMQEANRLINNQLSILAKTSEQVNNVPPLKVTS